MDELPTFQVEEFDVVIRRIRNGYLVFDIDRRGQSERDGTIYAHDGIIVCSALAGIYEAWNENEALEGDVWPTHAQLTGRPTGVSMEGQRSMSVADRQLYAHAQKWAARYFETARESGLLWALDTIAALQEQVGKLTAEDDS